MSSCPTPWRGCTLSRLSQSLLDLIIQAIGTLKMIMVCTPLQIIHNCSKLNFYAVSSELSFAGDYLVYYTNSVVNENSIGIVPGINWIVFMVRACSDASVFLQTQSGGTGEHYELILGAEDNTKTVLRGNNLVLAWDRVSLRAYSKEHFLLFQQLVAQRWPVRIPLTF